MKKKKDDEEEEEEEGDCVHLASSGT